jgi:hypothetical protein
MIECELCGKKSVIEVARHKDLGIPLFSCTNEECVDHAELLVCMNGQMEPITDILEAYKTVVEDITDEENSVSED